MKAFVWLSYDLGIRGDYEGLYQFLDSVEAKECANSIAAFQFDYDQDIPTELASVIQNAVKLDKRARFYVIYQNMDGKLVGKFIIGRRKSSPWTGYSLTQVPQEDGGE
jgi:hypothetical protein